MASLTYHLRCAHCDVCSPSYYNRDPRFSPGARFELPAWRRNDPHFAVFYPYVDAPSRTFGDLIAQKIQRYSSADLLIAKPLITPTGDVQLSTSLRCPNCSSPLRDGLWSNSPIEYQEVHVSSVREAYFLAKQGAGTPLTIINESEEEILAFSQGIRPIAYGFRLQSRARILITCGDGLNRKQWRLSAPSADLLLPVVNDLEVELAAEGIRVEKRLVCEDMCSIDEIVETKIGS